MLTVIVSVRSSGIVATFAGKAQKHENKRRFVVS
jgi:hypothetical protein